MNLPDKLLNMDNSLKALFYFRSISGNFVDFVGMMLNGSYYDYDTIINADYWAFKDIILGQVADIEGYYPFIIEPWLTELKELMPLLYQLEEEWNVRNL